MVVDIKIDTKELIRKVDGYKKTIPKGARRGIFFSALKMQSAIRKEIRDQNLIWTGRLLKGTRAKKLSPNVWGISMPRYGKALDSMRTHWVALKRGRKIRQWYVDKVSGTVPKAIQVRAHPFIQEPFLRVSRQTRDIVQREVDRAIRRNGR